MLETDSRIALSFIDKRDSVMWSEGSLVFDIVDLAAACDECKFQHVKREANSLAHNVAKYAEGVELANVWEGTVFTLSLTLFNSSQV